MIRKMFQIPACRIAAGLLCCLMAAGILAGCSKGETAPSEEESPKVSAGSPSDFNVEEIEEPPFEDVPGRTNNAFNVVDFGEQGTGGWFYRYGDSKRPERSRRLSSFDGEKYYQTGANGLEVKKTFLHTADKTAPILEWRAGGEGKGKGVVD